MTRLSRRKTSLSLRCSSSASESSSGSYPECLFLIRSIGCEELLRDQKAPEGRNRTRAFFPPQPAVFCLSTRHGLNTPHLLQTVDSVRLLHRRTAPPDEGEACLSNWQTDSRTLEVYDWTLLEHSSQPTLVLREFDIEVGGGSLDWYPGERHVMLSCLGSLRWSLSAFNCLPI